MKILQVIDTLNVGGAEKVFVDICNILNENQVDVSALFILKGGVLQDKIKSGILIYELNRKSRWNIRAMYQCSLIIAKFDIVHCHSSHVYRYIKLVSRLFFLKKIKIIFQDHNGIINVNKKIPLFFNSILKPEYYIGVSDVLVQWSINQLKIDKEQCFLLENIIVRDTTQDLSVKTKKYDLILVSNIKTNKNQLFGIQLANRLNKSMLLVGKIQDDKYNDLLHNSINIGDKTIQFDYEINEVQRILKDAKIGLHTSLYETGPLVLIEYLAQGLPFLSYDTGEVANILKPYFPEFFIDNFEIEQWEERINLLLSRKPEIDKMNEVFEKHFGKQQYFNKLKHIYQCIKN